MKLNKTTPCQECPFTRSSTRGWLGPWEIDTLLIAIGHEPFPCHKSIPEGGGDFDMPMLESCAGAAIFLNHKMEFSRVPVTAQHQRLLRDADPETKALVFQNAGQFRQHHDIFAELANREAS